MNTECQVITPNTSTLTLKLSFLTYKVQISRCGDNINEVNYGPELFLFIEK